MSPINSADLDKLSAAISSSMTAGFAQLQQALVSTIQQTSVVVTPKAAPKQHFLPKGAKAAPTDLAQRDAKIAAAFARKGFRVTLMDRADPKAPYDVRPYKGWLEVGRVVRRGQKGVNGLFHLTQTDALPSSKPSKGKSKPQLVKA